MTNTIHSLSDEQLDGIAGGTALPAALQQFVFPGRNGKDAIYLQYGASSGSSSGTSVQDLTQITIRTVPASTECMARIVQDAARSGADHITLYKGGDKTQGVDVSLNQINSWLNS